MKKIINFIFVFLILYFLCTNFIVCFSKTPDLFGSSREKCFAKQDLAVYSKRAIIYERNSKTILYDKNIDDVCKMASTTKIMTAIVVLEHSDLNKVVTVSKKAATTGGSRLGLHTGDKITVKNLLYGLLLCSGNDAAIALAESTSGDVNSFLALMNLTAFRLGLKSTHFESPHGLDSKNHFTTAYELAIITDYALSKEEFKKIVRCKNRTISINNYTKTISNTNELLKYKNVYGVKTGFTSKAGRCLVTSYKDDNLDIIIIVLGADTKKIRTIDSKHLIDYAINNYKTIDLAPYVKEVISKELTNYSNKISLKKSKSSKIKLSIEKLENRFVTLNTLEMPKLSSKNVFITTTLIAPIEKNIEISELKIYLDDRNVNNITISVCDKIYAKTPLYYLCKIFNELKNISNNVSI